MTLYDSPSPEKFTRLCGGSNNEDGEGESCPEIAEVPGGYALRDSANRAAGELRFTRDEMERLADRFRA
ncbi:DUF397 domain-containing protein [Microbispora sp. NPDC049633]|uniref:DUF397 domain-containing protein n=1 Tax=Microbispora sp. NPDC049633 TaxID=3154355 RepID=UPI003432582E